MGPSRLTVLLDYGMSIVKQALSFSKVKLITTELLLKEYLHVDDKYLVLIMSKWISTGEGRDVQSNTVSKENNELAIWAGA